MCLPVNGTYLVEVKRLDGYIDRVHCTRFADSAMLCYCVITLMSGSSNPLASVVYSCYQVYYVPFRYHALGCVIKRIATSINRGVYVILKKVFRTLFAIA